jgi:CBS domain-containing protein
MLVDGLIDGRHVLVRCDKCGTDLPSAAQYCFKCGSRVGKVVTEEFSVSSDDLVKKVKDILHEGNVNRIIVRDEQGKLLLEVPASAGLIGVILAPWLAALGAIAALVTECTISVERRE